MYYIGLSTTEIDENGSGYTEPTDFNYSRIEKCDFIDAESVAFPMATEDWGTIKCIFFSQHMFDEPVIWVPLDFRYVQTDTILRVQLNKATIRILKLIFGRY